MLVIDPDNNDIFVDIDADVNHLNVQYPQSDSHKQSEYYDVNKFNSLSYNTNSDLSIVHLNCRSLACNKDEIVVLLDLLKIKFDVICFTESWLTTHNHNLYDLDGYNSFHCLRPENYKRGGGISVFVRECFTAVKLSRFSVSLPSIESLFLDVSVDSTCFRVSTIYKPPTRLYCLHRHVATDVSRSQH